MYILNTDYGDIWEFETLGEARMNKYIFAWTSMYVCTNICILVCIQI